MSILFHLLPITCAVHLLTFICQTSSWEAGLLETKLALVDKERFNFGDSEAYLVCNIAFLGLREEEKAGKAKKLNNPRRQQRKEG